MSEVFVGQMQPFGFPFAPRGWKICDGSLLSIAQYQTLYALIGTTYGGNGTTNFAVPDTRGRTLLGQGSTYFGSAYVMGQVGGYEAVTLTDQNLPMHMHPMFASPQPATQPGPGGTEWLSGSNGSDPTSGDPVTVQIYGPSNGPTVKLQGVAATGGNQPVGILQPFLVNNYCIVVEGIYPSRN
jgi:microcystin-dependent protein